MTERETGPVDMQDAPRGVGWAGRRIAAGLNTGVALLLAAVLLLMVNYLASRHYRRWDWSRGGFYRLSEKTLNLLSSLTNDVSVVVFFQPNQDVYDDARNLLKEYEYVSRRIRVEWVDPDRDIARTEELARRYTVSEANVVVFDSAGRTKYVSGDDVMEMDYRPLQFGRPPEVLAFRGEQAFSSAIQSITQEKPPVVYFLQGHGERDIDDFNQNTGYSTIAQELRRDNMEVRKVTPGETAGIPADCDVLVIAGPQKELSPAEVEMIRAYLARKGSLMVLLDAMVRTGLEPLLSEWGIRLAMDVVVDATRTLTGRELFVSEYEPHPITRPLRGINTVFYLPRSVEPEDRPVGRAVDPADRPHVSSLASCSSSGWAETDLSQSPMKYDVEADRPGPVAIAVAAERGTAPGIDLQIRPTRLVVFGDSDFASNAGLTGGNSDFFLSALNWLAERDALMAIAPKPVEQIRLIMTRSELRGLFWMVVGTLPGLVAVLGVGVWLRRRS